VASVLRVKSLPSPSPSARSHSAERQWHTYEIEVYRDGRWFMIYVPEIDQLTQARHAGEIELMARELIAVSTGTPIRDVSSNGRKVKYRKEIGDKEADSEYTESRDRQRIWERITLGR
jgi:hypothetical protein